jgi:hypothetical protein
VRRGGTRTPFLHAPGPEPIPSTAARAKRGCVSSPGGSWDATSDGAKAGAGMGGPLLEDTLRGDCPYPNPCRAPPSTGTGAASNVSSSDDGGPRKVQLLPPKLAPRPRPPALLPCAAQAGGLTT